MYSIIIQEKQNSPLSLYQSQTPHNTGQACSCPCGINAIGCKSRRNRPLHRYVVMLTYIQVYLGLDATSSRRQSDNWVLRTTRGNHACQTKRFRTMYTFPFKQRRKIIFYLVGKNSGLCPRCHLPTSFVLGKISFQSQGEYVCYALFSRSTTAKKEENVLLTCILQKTRVQVSATLRLKFLP